MSSPAGSRPTACRSQSGTPGAARSTAPAASWPPRARPARGGGDSGTVPLSAMAWRSAVTRRYRRAQWVLVHRAWQAVQEAGVITADTPGAQKFASFGPGSMLAFPAGAVYGERWIRVGEGTLVGKHVTMCAGMVPGQDLGVPPVLRIGDRCVIGWGSHVVAHHSIDIGDDVFTGPYVYITDQNHGYG